MANTSQNKESRLKIYKNLKKLFESREDVYAGCYWNAKTRRYEYKCVKKSVTLTLLKKHCTDTKFLGIGIYPIINDDMTKFIAGDFDAKTEQEKKELELVADKMNQISEGIDLHLYWEKSKSGDGWHPWMFFSDPIKSWKARRFMMAILESAGATYLSSMDRLFPSQDRIYADGKGYGNLIHLPFSAGHIDKGTFFVDGKEKYTNDPDDMEVWLDNVQTMTPEYIDTMLDKWDLLKKVDHSLEYETDKTPYVYAKNGFQQVLSDPFIKWCKDNPKQVDYNAWLGLISNLLPYGDEGIKAIHDISSLDTKRYNRSGTQKQIIAWQGNNPITYNWILNNSNFDEKPDVTYKAPAAAGIKQHHQDPHIFENWGKYFYKKNKQITEISNFTIQPENFVNIDGKTERVFSFIGENYITKGIHITGELLSSNEKFRKNLLEISSDLLYYGTSPQLMRIQNYLNHTYQNIPRVTGKKAVGMYQHHITKDWLALTQHSAWTSDGKLSDYMYYNPNCQKELIFTPDPKISKSDIQEIATTLFTFNALHVVSVLLGWCFALMVKQRLQILKGYRFPVLTLTGQAGCGKSETARNILQRFVGDMGTMYIVGNQTKFVFAVINESTNMFPLFLDEYKPKSFSPTQTQMVSQMVRSLYDGTKASRGRQDLTIKMYDITSPAVICGEESFTEPALIERSVGAAMSKMESFEYTEGFEKIKKLPLPAFGNAFLNWTLTIPDEKLFEMYQQYQIGQDRTHHNITMLCLGLHLGEKFFQAHNVNVVMKHAIQEVKQSQLLLYKQYGEARSVVDSILEGIFTMFYSGDLKHGSIRFDDNEVALYIRGIYPQFRKWARDTEFEYEVISEMEFVRQLKKMSYYLEKKLVRFEEGEDDEASWYSKMGKPKKSRILNVKMLGKLGILDSGDNL